MQPIELHTGCHALPTIKENSVSTKGHQILKVIFGGIKFNERSRFKIHTTEFVQVKPAAENKKDPNITELYLMDKAKWEKLNSPANKYYRTYYNPLTPGFEFLECLAAKKVDLKDGREYFSFKDGKTHVITEATSGAKIAEGESIKIAISNAFKAISDKDMGVLIDENIKKYGLSPRYQTQTA